MDKRNVILDISRLFSRRFFVHDTGIDRVERGYLSAIPNAELLLRYGRSVFVFDKDCFGALMAFPAPKTISQKLKFWLALKKLSKRSMPARNSHYINVGHTGHPKWFWKQLKSRQIKISIMIHDVIPLDFPEFTRSDQVEKFATKFTNWCEFADVLITPSQYTRKQILAHSSTQAKIITLPLAVEPLAVKSRHQENAWLILGTIEPRKNHVHIIDCWEALHKDGHDDLPKLWIIGSDGWNNREILSRIENSSLYNQLIFKLGALTDIEMKDYFSRAKGLLFPSYCEGFGLPLYEAAISGKTVLASKIPAFTEALGDDCPNLVDLDNFESWKQKILNPPPPVSLNNVNTDWHEHINKVLT